MSPVNKNAFSLIEAVVSIAIFVLFALGIYGGTELVFKIVYASRLRILENGILNEQVEIIRNLSFHDVGIVNGSPAGLLTRTVTTTRNGIDFIITRTIRNIDDPFDGTVTGGGDPGGHLVELCHHGNTIAVADPAVQAHLNHGDTLGPCGGEPPPFDSSPADYKLVQIDIICAHCQQQKPLSMVTYVAPKFLEGDPTHGALFIEVFDSQAQPVQGATVHLVSTSTDPTYDFTETTDNDGMLRVVDLAAGTTAYSISVTKDGFTTDGTLLSSPEVPNPTKPLASVVAQDVSEVSFSIDTISSLAVSTINNLCSSVGSVSFFIRGTERIGTSPDVYLVDDILSTDGLGEYSFANIRWDTYSFGISGYDIIGSIPDVPLVLGAGVNQELQLVVGPNTNNSLLVIVRGSNDQPISNASVHVTSTSFDETKVTGFGSVGQTDWSGGSGQGVWSDETKYWVSNSVDVLTSPGDVMLTGAGGVYLSSGELESSIIDLGTQASCVQLAWEPVAQPPETGADSLKFQIATSPSSTLESWDYLGPDGTNATYYTVSDPLIHDIHDGDEFFRYKVYLETASTTYTPRLSDMSLIYTNSCTPPGQVYFGNLGSSQHSIVVSAPGYESYTTSVNLSGDTNVIVQLSESE
ncbi:MAG TPA: hypothetical protein DCS29_04515 [Candidatus Magasanikbacteria bacterium]|nr:MAG: hypothetical protein A2479_01180 [Candidatus Magasanikbacteria bacterium RIFOXYC2_FULL_39_8]HAT04004.1 hypothetical protein [Candidatus Magasanikbacteria bacterium]